MLDYLRLDGIDLHAYVAGPGIGREVSRVEGLVGLGAPKGESKSRTEAHGSTNRSRFQSSKTPIIEGECWGITIGDAYTQFDEVLDAFNRTLEEGAKLLTWQRAGTAVALQALVKLAGPLSPPLEEGAALLKWQAQLEQMDPRAYGQTLKTVVGTDLTAGGGGLRFPFTFPLDFDESAGGSAVVVNAGKIETPPVVRIYGPVTSPRYVLDSSARGVKITGEVAAGDYLEVDHAKQTVKLNGVTLRQNLLDVPASSFFAIPRGAHTVRLLAQNFGGGAHIAVDTRDAYGG